MLNTRALSAMYLPVALPTKFCCGMQRCEVCHQGCRSQRTDSWVGHQCMRVSIPKAQLGDRQAQDCAAHVLFRKVLILRAQSAKPLYELVGCVGITPLSRRTNQMQEAWVYSHDGPIRRRKRGYILMTDQSDAGSADDWKQYRQGFSGDVDATLRRRYLRADNPEMELKATLDNVLSQRILVQHHKTANIIDKHMYTPPWGP
eukprot:1181864-Prorocentrum_minimum.AAC.2